MMDRGPVLPSHLIPSLLAGAAAGTAVDVSLFPLDTVKTRLQSEQGFWRAGGFRNIYSGLGPAVLGSAPTAALFFCSYESTKVLLRNGSDPSPLSARTLAIHHMLSATVGEVIACVLRVPVENVKQKSQSSALPCSSYDIYRKILREESFRGLYRGYLSTVMREIPFSVIQFPLWEYLKIKVTSYQGEFVTPMQSALCGSLSGAIAAAVTTPLDVAKTRIMLAEKGSAHARGKVTAVLRQVYLENGLRGLFLGIEPRVTWIAIGGFIFLGVYEKVKSLVTSSVA